MSAERRGPAICNVSNIGEGKDEMTKASIDLQDLRRRIYVKAKADLLIAYLEEQDDAREVKTLVENEGRKAVLVAGDIQDPAHCRAIIQRAVDDLGGIDILVNNAAHQATFKDIGDISDEEWEMTFKVNIHAMFYLTKAAVPHMKPGSAIINTASVNSDMPNPILLAYAATKGAIQNFTAAWLRCSPGRAYARMRSHPDRYGRRSSRRPCRTMPSRISGSRCR